MPTASPTQAFSLTGSIAFVSTRDGLNGIYVIHFPNGIASPLLVDTSHAISSPAWSPDGKLIAYSSNQHRGVYASLDIFTMYADASQPTRLSSSSEEADHPAWSPDGKLIAFDIGDSRTSRVAVIDAGGGFRFYAQDGKWSGRPSFSPSGTDLAYLCGDSSPPMSICLYNLLTGETRRLPGVMAEPDGIAWAPYGAFIAYTEHAAGSYGKIFLANVETGGIVPLTDGPGTDRNPAWSPDGAFIAFESDRRNPSGLSDIFVVPVPGGDTVQVVESPGYDCCASWTP